ncbi:MAG: protease modulator HflK [Anaerohalosphaeraceae bacterium]|nr:protease modulator HflK [Anaerohalosphaeraceae bacterium]
MSQDHKHNDSNGSFCCGNRGDDAVFTTGDMDPGSKSLANALNISFSVLKVVMIVLVIAFFGSGVFVVAPDERAVVLRFGKIRGATTEKIVLGPGLHWAIPYPVEEVIRFPGKGTVKRVAIESFWYSQTNRPGETLNPIFDGYCLTSNDSVEDVKGTGGDYNIVHLKAQVNYRIADCVSFLKSVNVVEPPAGRNYIDVIPESISPLLTSLAREAIVKTMVNFTIDEAIKSDSQISRDVKKVLQAKLESIDCGVEIDSIQIAPITWPKQVDDAFLKSTKAKNDADTNIRNAKGYAESAINEAGGAEIFELVMNSDLTDEQKDDVWAKSSGSVRQKIAEAMAYRTKVVESAKANAEYLSKLLPEYQKRPELVLQRIYQDAIQEVLSNAEEVIIAQPSDSVTNKEFRVLVSRDPKLKDQKKAQ